MEEERNYYRKRSYFLDSYVENEGNKRRNLTGQRELQDLSTENTVYRYLCPNRKAGYLIGRGGEIVKSIRAKTGAKVEIEEALQGCEERIVTISSSSQETNQFIFKKDHACPAQDALFRVHDRLIEESLVSYEEDDVGSLQVSARFLIPSDQARCVIGRRGFTIQNIRRDTCARISIWSDEQIPVCANSSEELLEISGDALAVKKALFQISCLLHENPSQSHDYIHSKVSYNPYGCHLIRDPTTRPYSQAEESCDFTLRLVCPSINIREVIGKDGTNINQIRQQSGATINLDCFFDEEDCMILISAKESIGNTNSPTTTAATELLPGCSKRVDSDYAKPLYVTRLLVLRSQVGSLIGKGGLVIKEMRRTTQASISVLEECLPSIASEDDAMIQITGDLPNVRGAVIQVIDQLKARHFARKNFFSPSSTSSHYMSRSSTQGSVYTGRGFESYSQGYSNSSEHRASVGRVPLEMDTGNGCSQVDGDN